MNKLFISSHGHMASGMKSSLDILLGNSNRVTIFDAYVDETSVQDALDAFYLTVQQEDHVYLLSDLLGGSVNSTMYLYLDRPNTELIAGVNLAFVLELSMCEEPVERKALQQMVENSRQVLKLIEQDVPCKQEDFF